MQVIRYLNGKRLNGAMPQLRIGDTGICSLLGHARRRQEIPLRKDAGSAILEAEGGGYGKDSL